VQRAQAGDQEAKRIIDRTNNQAQNEGNPEAIKATIALAAAATALAALASKPEAKKQWTDAAAASRGEKYDSGETREKSAELNEIAARVKRGEASAAEADRGKRIAVSLGKPEIAAQISAIMPTVELDQSQVMSSMPDVPLQPISGWKELVKESLKAVFLATKDPIANYREGVQTRGTNTPLLLAPKKG
jgi:hypothetical protein